MLAGVLQTIYHAYSENRKLIAVLIDPDKLPLNRLSDFTKTVSNQGGDFIFVGGSLLQHSFQDAISVIKTASSIPIVIFPGNAMQISSDAHAFLLLSLLSGRNPEFLIGQHVAAAFNLWNSGLEIIPTSYLLIDGGVRTSVEYMSNTMPIPYTKPDIALATAMAGQMMGHKLVYLEAGSGAKVPVPANLIQLLASKLNIPMIVGGGIRTPEQLYTSFAAGATLAVIGTHLEQNPESISSFIACKNNF